MSRRGYSAAEALTILQQMQDNESESEDDNSLSDVESEKQCTEELHHLTSGNCSSDEQSSDAIANENISDSESFSTSESLLSIASNNQSKEFKAKSGRKWSSVQPKTSRVRANNICDFRPGPTVTIQSMFEAFNCFITDNMLSKIARFTNQHASAYYNNKGEDWKGIDIMELKAFLGLLLLFGVSKGNHENLREAWGDRPFAKPVFKATMSICRFESIMCHLRFDDSDTRDRRRAVDKFAPFRDIWNEFISNCVQNYCPSECVCIDEQLIPFRGRCPFRQYLPAKPDKYGMKLFLLADCNSGYIYDGVPYVGKEDNATGPVKGLASKIVTRLTEMLHNSSRNITADNYFSDFNLTKELLEKKLTFVGTVKKK